MINNVIIISDLANINGGSAKVAIMSAIGLAQRGYNVCFFSGQGPIDKILIDNKIKVVCLHQIDILNDPNRLRAIVQGIWNRKAKLAFQTLLNSYDQEDTIIHFHSWTKTLSASLFEVIRNRQFRVFVTLHDFFYSCPNGGFYNYKSSCICSIRPMSFRCIVCNCDVRNYSQKLWRCMKQYVQNKILLTNKTLNYIVISDLSYQIANKNLPKNSKIYKVVNPIDINFYTQDSHTTKEFYVFIGRLSKEKGVDMFCKAISELRLKGCVMGDGYLLEEIKKKYKNIIFTGWLTGKEKEKYILRSKALVISSLWYETFGLTVAEMKAYGIPSIVPDKCAASEQIIDGYNGLIYKIGDIESLKESLIKFEHLDQQKLQHNVLESFEKDNYSLNKHVDQLIQLYQNNGSL